MHPGWSRGPSTARLIVEMAIKSRMILSNAEWEMNLSTFRLNMQQFIAVNKKSERPSSIMVSVRETVSTSSVVGILYVLDFFNGLVYLFISGVLLFLISVKSSVPAIYNSAFYSKLMYWSYFSFWTSSSAANSAISLSFGKIS